MNDQVQEVKDRNDIVEVVSTYLTLKKAGVNYKANCPFHNEKSPSFMINPERQTFKCFGCGEGGDVLTFIEKMEGLDFYNALKLLAERAGIALKSNSVRYGDKDHTADKKTRIFEINDWTAKVYAKILETHPKAQPARDYLAKRGLTDQTIKSFEMGYAPNSWDFLLRFLASKNYKEAEAVDAGVAIKSEKGKIYDRFRGRIIFPINNTMGATIAFTSRILEDDGKSAKYINSSESPIYTKGKTIYGLDKAKVAIKEADLAIMVEGNMDVIACHQAGFLNVVATSGTALTADQLKTLSRYASEIALCFDTDEAGQTAMKRAVRLALANDISAKIITTAPFKDADEAITKDPKNWVDAVANSKPALEYWIDILITKSDKLDVAAKKKIAKEILPVIKATVSDIEKEHYIKYLSERVDVAEESLIEALKKSKSDNEFHSSADAAPAPIEKSTLEEKIVGLLWSDPNLAKGVAFDFDLTDSTYEPFWQMIKTGSVEREKIKPELALKLDNLALSAIKNFDATDDDAPKAELHYLLKRRTIDHRDQLREDFAYRISEAEKRGDKDAVKKLLSEFSSLIK